MFATIIVDFVVLIATKQNVQIKVKKKVRCQAFAHEFVCFLKCFPLNPQKFLRTAVI